MSVPDREPPVIGFLTDFGLDGAAAICRAVMLSICRDAQIADISHTIAKYAVADGAWVLRTALPWFPVGAHLAVVDPGVGTERRPIAIRVARGDVLVGPDNGLLGPAAEALGGIDEVRELTERVLWLPRTSATFHGRDVFAPVTARLAAGTATFDQVGPRVEPAGLVRLPEPSVVVEPGLVRTEVTYVDSFGNARLAGDRSSLDAAGLGEGEPLDVAIAGGPHLRATRAPSFGHVEAGAVVLYVDSAGDLALAVNQGSLAGRTGVTAGVPVRIGRADGQG